MLKIGRIFEFEAAHKLPYHNGVCKNVHGHRYILEIKISGSIHKDSSDAECGMIMDFGKFKEIVEKKVVSRLDHVYLNDIVFNPCAERLVDWIWEQLENELFLEEIKLWETSKCYAEKTRQTWEFGI